MDRALGRLRGTRMGKSYNISRPHHLSYIFSNDGSLQFDRRDSVCNYNVNKSVRECAYNLVWIFQQVRLEPAHNQPLFTPR